MCRLDCRLAYIRLEVLVCIVQGRLNADRSGAFYPGKINSGRSYFHPLDIIQGFYLFCTVEAIWV